MSLLYAVPFLRWLRFLGFAIYGRKATSPVIDDYTANIKARSYYFVLDGETRLVDVDAVDDGTSDASDLTIRRRDYWESVVARDGTCVIMDEIDENCNACHILPHSKGSNVRSRIFYSDWEDSRKGNGKLVFVT